EGYPFDYASVSALSVAYPLLVSHFSKDGEWAFVQNDTVWGWIQSSNLKILDENSAEIYKNSNFLTILKDNAQIYDENNATIFLARSGTILPYESQNNAKFSGKFLSKMGYKKYFVNSSDASKFPAKLNNENLQILTNSLISQSYGWGGTSFLRDCSLMTKDFLANFGIWLPRNSKAQSNAGLKYELSEFSNAEKLEFIKIHGIAYRTLLYLSGHIMLYVGEINGEVAVLHSVWGLRTINDDRAVIGKTALTTLEIGKNRPDIAKDRLLLSRISAMTILGE
ncbi:MAG: SH3 domain-containing protein, partial [Campylobacter sp.]|nr:SH3 domain-containing protein [Campylobacter sp.]